MKRNKSVLLLSILLAGAGIISCTLVPPQQTSSEIVWLEQGWSDSDRQKFHHASQGTMTLPIPYEWFVALEQPGFKLFGANALLTENGYLESLGFISSQVSKYNQAGLPVGFSTDYDVTNPQISKTNFNAVGLTCAACHTGQMRVGDKSIRYDGGPAMTNLTQLTTVLGLALIETYLSSSRFDRFSQQVLGITNTKENKAKLRSDLKHTLKALAKQIIGPEFIDANTASLYNEKEIEESKFVKDIKLVKEAIESQKNNKATTEGFTRLDALNRIGNTVFGSDTNNFHNIATIEAPVNYPHIWNTSWFMWVQYDASIMGPMIRNAGEAMGVVAYVVLDEKAEDNFNSSVRLQDIHWMESLLAGDPPTKHKQFTGLQHPQWDEALLGPIDREKHGKGAVLYKEHCQGCHLPPMDSDAFWSDKYWTQPDKFGGRYLDLPIVHLDLVGTDPQEALVLINRTVDTRGIGLNTPVYLESEDWFKEDQVYFGAHQGEQACKPQMVKDGPQQPFSLSLGAAVQEVNNYWYKAHNTPQSQQDEMNGYRPNCLRAPLAYKARPLNGIWATAPFLHNGSVPSIFDLLSPVAERPKEFYLGSLDYDVKNMGYNTDKGKGLFLLKTNKTGNSNTGHEFSDTKGKGVIGRKLSVEERYQIIEYLKDIKVVN